MNNRLLPKPVHPADEIQLMGSTDQLELGTTIRCLVWNIFKAKRQNWLADFQALSHGCDLVLIQEAVRNAPSDHVFMDSRRLEWVMAGSHQHPLSGVVTGVKTGCIAVSQKRVLHRSNYSEPLVKTRKLLLETHYALPGTSTTLMVLNMHAINFVRVSKFVDQLEQLNAALATHAGPVVLAGDFNTWSFRRLGYFREVAGGAGLTEASMTRRTRIMHLNQHLDHVFYRGLSLRSVESLQHIISSDHAPITATFRILKT